MMSSSASDPLRYVVVPGIAGEIGMFSCPRNWKADLESAASTGVAAIGVLTAPEAMLDPSPCVKGPEWHRLPVADSIPGQAFEEVWCYSGLRMRLHLREGRRVWLAPATDAQSCDVILARLLSEFGVPPEHPASDLTEDQADYLRRCRPVSAATDARNSRIAGCLFGGAAGDAFGHPVQFKPLPAIRARYGAQGIQAPQFQYGKLIVSDETQMTLFTLEGLWRGLRIGEPLEQIRRAYLDWLDTQGYGPSHRHPAGDLASEPVLRVERDAGTTCVNALKEGGRGAISKPPNNSKGCGGLMRVAPIGIFPDRLDMEEAFLLGSQSAALTHGHPSGYLCAGVMAAIVRRLMDDVPLRQAAEESLVILRRYAGHQETLTALERGLGSVRKVQELGAGWVAEEAFAIALYSALNASTFNAALALAANHDGDSNSSASLAGQLWGAWKGITAVPHDWVSALDVLVPALTLLWRVSASRCSAASRT